MKYYVILTKKSYKNNNKNKTRKQNKKKRRRKISLREVLTSEARISTKMKHPKKRSLVEEIKEIAVTNQRRVISELGTD